MCRSSGRGCTVIPSAPKRCASTAAFTTSGLLPPRLLRSVASLLILTESFVGIEAKIIFRDGKIQKNKSPARGDLVLLSDQCLQCGTGFFIGAAGKGEGSSQKG